MHKEQTPIRKAVDLIGGYSAAARLCGVTYKAVVKWCDKGLPLTELSGQTSYAKKLAAAHKEISEAELIGSIYDRPKKAVKKPKSH